MHDHQTDEAWASEDAAVQAAPPTGVTSRGASEGLSGPHVLARMPDLDAEAFEPDDDGARSEGRLVSRRLATRLLVGGGVLLVLAAVVPWWLQRTVEGEGGKTTHPEAPVAPLFDAQAARPSDNQPTRLQPQPPDLSLDIQVPEGEFDFMNGPSGGGDQDNPASSPAQPIDGNMETRRRDRLPEQPTLKGERPLPRVSRWPARQTWDNPVPPAGAGYPTRTPQRTDSFRLPPNVSHGLMPDPADRQFRHPPNAPSHPQAAVNRPMSIGTPGPVQPGIAQLEGIIQDPPARTTYDRNRPSVH